jgi:hypothetical protein
MPRALVWLNLYGHEAVQHKLKISLKTQKIHFLLDLNEIKQPIHMRYHLFLHYGWFLQNLGKDLIQTNMHTTITLARILRPG